ncbi:MAG TPA: ATP-dependent zinc metalloprotease FtsH [Nitrospiria bacterium]|nr:ATP-dependent zinc metalloprotease FtsH [Nitrospiria bacterium]
MEKKTRFSIWYFLIAVGIVWLLQLFLLAPHEAAISYSQFKQLVAEKKVYDLTISDQMIHGKLEAGVPLPAPSTDGGESQKTVPSEKGHPFKTIRVEDPDLVKELQAKEINFSGTVENTFWTTLLGWLIPMALFLGLWFFLIRSVGPQQGLMTIGKSKAKIYVADETKVTFKDVAGIDEAKAELQEVIEFLKNPEKFQRLGARIPKGVLLVGAPGTGKTLLAKAVAGEARVPFLSLTGSDFVEMFVGVGAARVRDLFATAQSKAPCIIFIDELDALGKARGVSGAIGGHDEREQTLNQLLAEMDGFDPNKGVIIMAATNRPEILDAALLRAGRFDRHVLVDRPDINGREAILRIHARQVTLSPKVDLKTIAARTPGFVGADLANIVNEATLLAARKNKAAVEPDDFEEAIDRVVAGLEKKSRLINPKEKRIVAYHEGGHALVTHFMTHTDKVHRISIIPRGIAALGYTLQLPTEDRYLMSRSELVERLAILLGGRSAEEIVFGEISTGAQNDLQKATEIAKSMVKEYGMSEALGPIAYEKERRPLFLETGFAPSAKDYSEETAEAIDREIKRLIDEAHERALLLLKEHRDKLDRLAAALLEKEVLEGDEVKQLLA